MHSRSIIRSTESMAHPSKVPYYLIMILVVTTALQAIGNFYLYSLPAPSSAQVATPAPTHVSASGPEDRYRIDMIVVTRMRMTLNDITTVSGIAQPGDESCDHFKCPAEYKAVQTVHYSVDDILNGTTRAVYCRCVLEQDAPLLNLMLRFADLITSSTALQMRLKRIRDSLDVIQDRMQTISQRAPTLSRKARAVSRRAVPVAEDTNFTYVPPPKTDVTPALLAESLAVQPQDTATVGSIMPHFQDGVISYGVQLNGLIAATMTLNASTTLPCANIGSSTQAQPDLVLRPKDIDNGTAQPYIPDCSIVAVNMYDPNVIHYWVMNPAGEIFSLVGSNKLMQIDQLNSTASMSLVLRATSPSNSKRDDTTAELRNGDEIVRRAMSQPDIHTATMTAEACAAITCNNNGGRAAVFQPFTKTCLCQNPVYVEIENA